MAKKSAEKKEVASFTYQKKSVYESVSKEEVAKAFTYAEDYKKFLDICKTEREAVAESVRMCEAKGFVPFRFGDKLKVGGKYYYNNRDKNFFAFVIGSEPVSEGVRITGAHIDSPRLDLKPVPLYEDLGMA
ncbi:MAG: aminopeptidase, partial [Clostridia bacterium]|nr:aminopeptidase [Clostridia bacterium]